MAQSDLGRLTDAKRFLSRLVRLAPDHVNGLVALGIAQQRSGDTAKARRLLEEAVAKDPTNGYAQRNLGGVLSKLELHQEAEAPLRAAHDLLPRDQAAAYGLALCLSH